ncbi:MAG: papain-like cysteine protease family protein [Alphaproteobacteria bacterium]
MQPLPVSFFEQIKDGACGAAAFEMVFRYYRPSRSLNFSQMKLFKKQREREPHGSGSYRITTEELVTVAQNKRFHAGWGRVSPDAVILAQQVRHFVETEQVPLIACQRYTDAEYTIGHFRVITGIDDKAIQFHDPCPKTGGESIVWPLNRFIDHWKQTGQNVTGGVAIWIAKSPFKNNPLLPDLPNPWDHHQWRPANA